MKNTLKDSCGYTQKSNKSLLFSLSLLFLTGFSASVSAQRLPGFPRPCGIYVLGGGKAGQHFDNISDSPFVDGYTLRVSWAEFETAKNIYNFKVIDTALSRLQPLHQKLTILLNIVAVPAYILKLRNVQTFVNEDGDTTVLPWDNASTPYLNAFLDTLSKYKVKSGSKKVALKDHPVFKQIEAQVKGLGKLRDPGGWIGSLPGYKRKVFTNTCVSQIQQYMNDFPSQFKYLAFFNVHDSITIPTLTDTLRWVFNKKFNSNLSVPTLGYFQEDLACSTPNTSYAAPLYKSRDTTYNMFQMLQGWMCPFADPSKTDPCKTNISGPDVGMRYGVDSFYATYFEVYICDVNTPGYSSLFRHWHDTLMSLCGKATGVTKAVAVQDEFRIYPNPMNEAASLQIIPAKGNIITNYELSLYNFYGKKMRKYKMISTVTTIQKKDLQPGLYFYQIKNKEQIVYKGNLVIR